jgi:ABC-type transport system involved in multi-copper enzyme maturation, permease component
MGKIVTLARTTLSEMLREKLFLVVILIAALLLGMSVLFGALSFAEQKKILADFGFLAIEISSLAIALFSGSFLISKEIEKQTLLLMLSRPVSRGQFIFGKFAGVLAVNTLLILFLGLVLGFLLKAWEGTQLLSFAEICLSLWMQSLLILAMVLMLSLIVRPVLALSLGMVTYLLGQWLGDLEFFAEKSKEIVFIRAVEVLHWITPNFYRMNWKSAYFLENGIPGNQVVWMLVHCLGWFVLLMLVTNFLFRRKDIV